MRVKELAGLRHAFLVSCLAELCDLTIPNNQPTFHDLHAFPVPQSYQWCFHKCHKASVHWLKVMGHADKS